VKNFTVLYGKKAYTRALDWDLENLKEHEPEVFAEMMANFLKTHTPLATIRVPNMGDIFGIMQGENWSSGDRQEKAQAEIKKLGLRHTTMRVGDLVIDHDTRYVYYCDDYGWTELDHFEELTEIFHGTTARHLEELNKDLLHINDLYPIQY
jgi:hydroxymethylpyrimidine/phosphomethylpyrimidine kinase